jgi:hypothetical protein
MPVRCSARVVFSAVSAIASFLMVSCGLSEDGAGGIWVDPGKYTYYHCNDLATRWNELTARESELRELMNKASETAAGAVVGSVAYRPDYESVLTEEKLVQRRLADQKCNTAPAYQSDQTIR